MNSLYSPKIDTLIQSLKCLPGVGSKSAQRLAFHLLEKNQEGAITLSNAIVDSVKNVKNCTRCYILTEDIICQICENQKRDHTILCVVETPSDVLAIEQSRCYSGLYFVLMGHLSPIDGIGPEDIGIPKLIDRISQENINEIILATNSTIEGEATSHYISEIAKKHNIKTSRIAHGIPIGGELEYIDPNTISQAITHRAAIT